MWERRFDVLAGFSPHLGAPSLRRGWVVAVVGVVVVRVVVVRVVDTRLVVVRAVDTRVVVDDIVVGRLVDGVAACCSASASAGSPKLMMP